MGVPLEARILLATIPIFSTGVDSSGTILTEGSADPHFQLISAPTGGPSAIVLNGPVSTYVPNSSTSQWIGPTANPFDTLASGDYTYQETFDLSNLDPTTAVIQGQLASDNDSKILLNGVDTGVGLTESDVTSPADFASLHPFTLAKGFVVGLNTLDVVVHNDYSSTGLRLDLSGSASTTSSVFLDLNANGLRDAGEPGLAGRVVYLDLNRDGQLDGVDPSATTDALGDFQLPAAGTGSGPLLEATAGDASGRYVVDQTQTNANGTVNLGVVPFSPVAPVPVVPNPFGTVPGTDSNTAYVQSLYHAVLGRVGAADEVASWIAEIDRGTSLPAVAAGFINSPEHRNQQVDAYYEDFLHRAPDPYSGDWVADLEAGASEESVAEGILDSPESQAAHADPTLFVLDLYLDVLGRQGEPAGVAGWVAALASGASRESIVADFIESPESATQIVNSDYVAYLHRPDEQGTTAPSWVTFLEAPGGSASNVAIAFLSSPEYFADVVPKDTP